MRSQDGDGILPDFATTESAYLHAINQFPLLTAEEELSLANLVLSGDNNARIRMIESNLRLVVYIAKPYANQYCPLLDLIQEGNIGLMKAVDRYQPTKNTRFSTYAVWWIRNFILRYIYNRAWNIRLPINVHHDLILLNNYRKRYMAQYGREPSISEEAKALGKTEAQIKELRSLRYMDTASLNITVGKEENDTELIDLIQDERNESPENTAIHSTVGDLLAPYVAKLPDNLRYIITERYGLNGNPPKTLKTLALELNVTTQRVQQLEDIALRRLRRLQGMGELKSFTED